MSRRAVPSPVSKEQSPDDPLTGKDCLVCGTPLRGNPIRKYCSLRCCNKAVKLRARWNLSVEEWDRLVEDAGGVCFVCQRPNDRWVMDHDHGTMALVSVVCSKCNMGIIAYCNHDLAMVKRLVQYLEEPQVDRVLGSRKANPKYARHADSRLESTWVHSRSSL